MRKYEPIWNALKVYPYKVELSVPPKLHSRVLRMVMKEKDQDLGFKLLASEKNAKYKISYISEHTKLTITMVNVKPITVESL